MISLEEIENLAQLARLRLGEEEAVALQKDISNILEYVETVSTVEIPQNRTAWNGTEKKLPEGTLYNVLREDVPRGEDDPLAGKREHIVAAFPRGEPARPDDPGRSGGKEYLVVRKIIQKDE